MADYDLGIIGSGPGGYVAALRAAQLGATVCVVEKEHLGGTCLNVGCIPTKAMLHAAELLHAAQTADTFGLHIDQASVDLGKVVDNKDRVVGMLRQGVASLFKKSKVDVREGHGRLLDGHTIEVAASDTTVSRVTAERIILASGSRPRELPMFPFDAQRVVSSSGLLSLRTMPARLLVVGGGVIGCELASLYADFGAKVTVVEMLETLLPNFDADLCTGIEKVCRRRKIDVHTGTRVEKLHTSDSGVRAELSNGNPVDADVALIAVGRALASDDLGVEQAGVRTEGEAIVIDEHCATSVPGVYAIGDVTGKMQLAHLASRMGLVAAENATGHPSTINYDVVPWGIFTRPQMASVGLTEKQAREQVASVKVARFEVRRLGIALAYAEPDGFVKLIGDEQTGEILGAHILGAHAPDVIHGVAVGMQCGGTVDELAETIHAHPTFSEGVMEAAHTWLDRPVHG